MLVAFALGALFNAPAMKKTALEMPYGGERSFRLALVDPLAEREPLAAPRPAGEAHRRRAGQARTRPDRTQVVVATPDTRAARQRRQAGEEPAAEASAQAVQGASDAPLHRRRLHDGPARHGAHQPLQQDEAHQAAARLPPLDRPGAPGLLQLAGCSSSRGSRRSTPAPWPSCSAPTTTRRVQSSSGKIHQFGSDGWKKEYRKRVEDAIALLFQGGVRRVYWIGQPVMPDVAFNGQIKVMNDIYRSVAEKTLRGAVHRRVLAALERQRRSTRSTCGR